MLDCINSKQEHPSGGFTLEDLLEKGEGALVRVLVSCFSKGTLLDLDGRTSGLFTFDQIGGVNIRKAPTLMLAFILEERRRCCPPPPPPAPAAAWQAGLVLILPIGMI